MCVRRTDFQISWPYTGSRVSCEGANEWQSKILFLEEVNSIEFQVLNACSCSDVEPNITVSDAQQFFQCTPLPCLLLALTCNDVQHCSTIQCRLHSSVVNDTWGFVGAKMGACDWARQGAQLSKEEETTAMDAPRTLRCNATSWNAHYSGAQLNRHWRGAQNFTALHISLGHSVNH